MIRPAHRLPAAMLVLAFCLDGLTGAAGAAEPPKPTAAVTPWQRHTIDKSSRGADGVRLLDVNGDGHMDIATGWEEGGVVRAYLNPGHAEAKQPWPAVTVGKVKSAEDAVLVDLDGDGAADVVSACEGRTQALFAHWAPQDPKRYLDPKAWTTQPFPASVKKSRWMFTLPMQIDGKHGVDLIVGSKNPNGMVGWLEAPANARDMSGWKLHKLYTAGWIMSLIGHDMDGDGDTDVLISDRKGKTSGVLWLENPGPKAVDKPWAQHRVGLADKEVMFIAMDAWRPLQVDGPPVQQIVAGVKRYTVCLLTAGHDPRKPWSVQEVALPQKGFGGVKAVRAADFDLDGHIELLVTCEGANGPLSGIYLMDRDKPGEAPNDWKPIDIGGPKGVKYDRIELLDLDGDGDLDAITCEERDQLGVIWYENPAK